MKQLSLFLFLLGSSYFLQAQIGINTDNSTPNASAMLDVKSTDKGMLIPRMTSNQRILISSPAIGLLVFDTDTESFWFRDASVWVELVSGNTSELADDDADTKIQVEESADEDVIRFDIGGTEMGRMDGKTFHLAAPKSNLFVGENAGSNHTGGSTSNTFIGIDAGKTTTTGATNTSLGRSALTMNNTGSQNTAIGAEALHENQDGVSNVAVGLEALYENISGYGNTAVGNEALDQNEDGNFNTAIGLDAGVTERNLSNATAIGALAKVSQDNSLVLGHQAKVGIGTSTPDEKLHVVGNTKIEGVVNINNEFSFPTTDGTSGQVLETDGSGALTWANKSNSTSLEDNDTDTKIQVEESADEDVIRFDIGGTEKMVLNSELSINTPTTVLAAQRDALTIRTSDNASESGLAFRNVGSSYNWSLFRQPVVGNTGQAHLVIAGGVSQNNPASLTERFRISNTGNVGIGIAAPDEKLHVNGNAKIGGILNINNEFSFPTTDGTTGQVLQTDGSGTLAWANNTSNTDKQTIDAINLNGTTLELSLENDGEAPQTVDLASINAVQSILQDADSDTKIQVEESADEDVIRFDIGGTEKMVLNSDLNINTPTIVSAAQRGALTIRTSDNASESGLAFRNVGSSYNWSLFRQPVAGNVGQAHLVIAGGVSQNNPASLTERFRISNTGNVGIGIAAPEEKLHVNGNAKIGGILNINNEFSFPTTDGTTGQVLQTDGSGALSWVDNISNTDKQTIDGINLNGTTLELSLENDGEAPQTVDLASINAVQNILQDADSDTKIQVEESADEDVIRFDVEGTEYFRMNAGRLEVFNTGHSVFLGEKAGLNDVLSDNRNVFIGYEAGVLNTTGIHNIAMGSSSLALNTSGSFNVGIGNAAGENNETGARNTFLGYSAGSGSAPHNKYNNVMVGFQSGFNSIGSKNVFLGYHSGGNELGSDKLYIENSNSSSPLIYGEFDNDLLRINGDLKVTNNTAAKASISLEAILNGINKHWDIETVPHSTITTSLGLRFTLADAEQVKFTSDGDIEFGGGNYHPPAYDRKTVMVSGKISENGLNQTTVTSSSWINSVTKNGTGDYTVNFVANTFADEPTITVTAFRGSGGTNRFAVLESVALNSFRVKIRNDNGNLNDAPFNFIAIGER